MASLLRQLVAGPRTRHPEANLDLCYVTPQIIATSGPSGTYPQLAYRNPLDQLVKFLDEKHGDGWAIWEFRAEGTGYPDEAVYGRVWHYPWPDHHPPPFGMVPLIMGGMRSWLGEGQGGDRPEGEEPAAEEGDKKKVVVVHCKAGKGRSGTMACSYLISECGWTPADALARFTERRMRPGFGQGVSIPSQLRWIGYVDRWTKGGKKYVERQIEILEIHVWGLRDGVKVQIEGYINEGKTIKVFHCFSKAERTIVEGNTPGGGGLKDMVSDMAGFSKNPNPSTTTTTTTTINTNANTNETAKLGSGSKSDGSSPVPTNRRKKDIIDSSRDSSSTSLDSTDSDSGGSAVIFRPAQPLIMPTSDINVDFERRSKASMGWTMVTAVAHVWFNAFFEGGGPEQDGRPDANGVFEIEWDKMDGIKGSSRKGTRALDRFALVWRAVEAVPGQAGTEGVVISEPEIGSPVQQMAPADWKGTHYEPEKHLGPRPVGEDVTGDDGVEGVLEGSAVKASRVDAK